MKDYSKVITDSLTVWKDCSANLIPEEDLDKIQKYVMNKLQNMNPTISVFGAYNAGKSTLLNAILGEELFKVGDVPTTYNIDKHNWGSWTIYDTPGIDAPIEHEETTNEHLRESECILFVISTNGDFEMRALYEKLADLIQRGKPVLLVFNDKTGVLRKDDPSSEAEIYSAIDINLDKIWEERNLGKYKRPDRIIVNAKSALNAKLSAAQGEPKDALLIASGVPKLEQKLEGFIRNVNEDDIVNSIIDYLEKPFNEATVLLTKQIDDGYKKKIEETKAFLDNSKRKLLYDSEKLIRLGLKDICNNLSSIDPSEIKQAEAKVTDALEDLVDKLKSLLEERLREIEESYQIDFLEPLIELYKEKSINNVTNQSFASYSLDEVEKYLNFVPKEKISEFLEKHIATLLNKLTEMWPKLAKLGKYASHIATAVIAFIEIGLAYRKQQEIERQERAKAEALENSIARLREDIYGELMRGVKGFLEEFFQKKLDSIEKIATDQNSEVQKSSLALEKLRESRSMLDSLKSIK
ncbi:MAG: dynamin family protein [Deferribacterales bacterium]